MQVESIDSISEVNMVSDLSGWLCLCDQPITESMKFESNKLYLTITPPPDDVTEGISRSLHPLSDAVHSSKRTRPSQTHLTTFSQVSCSGERQSAPWKRSRKRKRMERRSGGGRVGGGGEEEVMVKSEEEEDKK